MQEAEVVGRISVCDDAGQGKTLGASQRVFVPGYAVTAYASQGKTVDTVLLAYSGEHFPANRHQWYVGISRSRKKAIVFTDDQDALWSKIEQESGRELAMSLNCDPEQVKALDAIVRNSNHLMMMGRQTVTPPQVPQIRVASAQQQSTQRGIRL